MKTLLLIGTLLFQSVLVLIVIFSFVLKAGSMTGFYYIPWEFYLIVSIPLLTFISLLLFYFTGSRHPRWKKSSRIIASTFVTVCIAFLLYGLLAELFDGLDLSVALLMMGLIFSGILTFFHVQQC